MSGRELEGKRTVVEIEKQGIVWESERAEESERASVSKGEWREEQCVEVKETNLNFNSLGRLFSME